MHNCTVIVIVIINIIVAALSIYHMCKKCFESALLV